jgi:hypothetical protein
MTDPSRRPDMEPAPTPQEKAAEAKAAADKRAADKAAKTTKSDASSAPLGAESLNDSAPTGGRAGESGDPVVQRLLAIKQGHQMNRDAIDPPVVDVSGLDAIDEVIAEVDDELADLGFPQESQADRKARLRKEAEDAKAKVDAVAKRRADRAEARDK